MALRVRDSIGLNADRVQLFEGDSVPMFPNSLGILFCSISRTTRLFPLLYSFAELRYRIYERLFFHQSATHHYAVLQLNVG
jgi:hypothetical protein